jgi:hypothetical protein
MRQSPLFGITELRFLCSPSSVNCHPWNMRVNCTGRNTLLIKFTNTSEDNLEMKIYSEHGYMYIL